MKKKSRKKKTLKENINVLDITVLLHFQINKTKTLEENAPSILTMLETLKGTGSRKTKEWREMFLEIFNNFI